MSLGEATDHSDPHADRVSGVDSDEDRADYDTLADARPSDVDDIERDFGLQQVLAATLGTAPMPTRIGRYVVREKLGEGGMGVVYRARDEELHRDVAVKLVRARTGSAAQDRLVAEARALARVNDPHVVAVHEVGSHEGRVFVAMDLVRGADLRKFIAAQPSLSRDRLLEILIDAGKGLHAAHRAGLVHRDVKPENVLVGRNGRVVVVDFGLATAVRSAASSMSKTLQGTATREGDAGTSMGSASISSPISRILDAGEGLATPTVRGGTPGFMSPEQLRGDPLDARSDQWGYCKTIETALTLWTSRERAAGRRVPRDRILERLLARGMAQEPRERHESVGHLVRALEARRSAKKRWRWGLGLSAVLVTSVSITAWLSLPGPSADPRQAALAACHGADARLHDAQLAFEERTASLEADDQAAPAGADGGSDSDGAAAAASSRVAQQRADIQAVRGAVLEDLRHYAASWGDLHAQICEQSLARAERSGAAFDRRMRCLEDRADRFELLLDTLAPTDAYEGAMPDDAPSDGDSDAPEGLAPPSGGIAAQLAIWQASPEAIARLPEISVCEDDARLERIVSAASLAPDVAAEVEDIDADLRVATTEFDLGVREHVLEEAESLLKRATATDFPPVIARTSLLLARVRTAARAEQAEAAMHAAYNMALRGFDDETALAAATELARYAYDDAGDLGRATNWNDTAAALADRANAGTSARVWIAGNRAYIAMFAYDLEAAEGHFRAALSLLDEDREDDRRLRALMLGGLGNMLDQRGAFRESISVQEDAIASMKAVAGSMHPSVLLLRSNFATTLLGAGELERARREYLELLQLCEIEGRVPHVVTSLYLNLAELERQDHHLDLAESYADKAIASLGDKRDERRRAIAYSNLAAILEARGRYAEALEASLVAIEIMGRTSGVSDPASVALERVNEAVMRVHLGQHDTAREILSASIETLRSTEGSDRFVLAQPLKVRAWLELDQGRGAQALADLDEALAGLEAADAGAIELASSIRLLRAEALVQLNRLKDAIPVFEQGREPMDPELVEVAWADCVRAYALRRLGRDDEAKPLQSAAQVVLDRAETGWARNRAARCEAPMR